MTDLGERTRAAGPPPQSRRNQWNRSGAVTAGPVVAGPPVAGPAAAGRAADAPSASVVEVVGYRRVSTDEQAGEWKQSLAQQTERLHALAARLDRTLDPGHIFEDRFSGETFEKRVGFQGLLTYCRTHPRLADRFGLVLVYDDSRFGRFPDPDQAAALRFQLKCCGWVVRFCVMDDTDDPTARHVLRAIGGAGASEYRRALKDNTRKGTRGAAAQGLWLTKAPLGYRRAVQPPRGGPPGAPIVLLGDGQRKPENTVVRLALGPADEVEAVRWMFAAYASGEHTLDNLATALDVRCPGRRWSRQTVREKLVNPAYVGDVVWCRRPADADERRACAGGRRPERDWVKTRNAHPALVTRALFAAVEDRLGQFKGCTRPDARGVGGYPLSGLLTCAQCGSPYVGGGTGGNVGRTGGDRERYRFYRDRGGRAPVAGDAVSCPGKCGVVRAHHVEPAVLDAVASAVSDPRMLAAVGAELRRALTHDAAGEGAARRRAAAQVARLEREQGNLLRALREGTMSDALLRPEAERVERELADARAALAEAERACDPRRHADLEAEIARGLALAADFRARAAELAPRARRELLAQFLEAAVVDKLARTVTLVIRHFPSAGPAEPEVPGGARDAHGRRGSRKHPTVASESGRKVGGRREAQRAAGESELEACLPTSTSVIALGPAWQRTPGPGRSLGREPRAVQRRPRRGVPA